MEKLSKNNGISLIALVVTIIVLIILAGITINSIIGDNGIIKQAQKTKENVETHTQASSNEIKDLVSEMSGTDGVNPLPSQSEYTLSLILNGGTLENTSYKGKCGETVELPTPDSPEGYLVAFDANGGDCSTQALNSVNSFKEWTLYEGYGNVSNNVYTFDEGDGKIIANYQSSGVILPTPSKAGYTFNGWYTSTDANTKIGNAGDVYYPESIITLYAIWDQIVVPDLDSSSTTFVPSNSDWTNSSVTVTASTTINGYTLQTTQSDPTVETNWQNSSTQTFSSNGTMYARLSNGLTSGNYTSYSINNIDTSAPTVYLSSNRRYNLNYCL